MKKETAIFGMGCFWKPELLFSEIKGVLETSVGFMGGIEDEDINYEKVCSDLTGHAEVVRVEFDPSKVSYGDLLDIFWNNHNPTQGNRQGPDVGSQYRSVIFYMNDKQKKMAEESKRKIQTKFDKKITTEIKKAGKFFKAEEYHQKYLEKRGLKTCHI